MMRMIIEGMDPDNTNLNYVIYNNNKILDKTTVLETNFPNYKLTLVGRINEKGAFIKKELQKTIEEKIKYDCIGMPESPQTIIIEDGRVFTWASESRLKAVLKGFEYAGGFENVYQQIQANPGKFYNGTVCVKDGILNIIQKK